MKLINLLLTTALAVSFFACSSDDVSPEEQSAIDDKAIISYLKEHYRADDGSIKKITDGATPFFESAKKMNVTKNGIDYQLYYVIEKQGTQMAPTVNDSVLVHYRGFLSNNIVFDQTYFGGFERWLYLKNSLEGIKQGMTKFKSGTKEADGINFTGFGEGLIVMPSGLGYGNIARGIIPENSILIFDIALYLVKKTDADQK